MNPPGAPASAGAAAAPTGPPKADDEPSLVQPGRWSPRDRCHVFPAVDYMGERFHLGEHVAVKASEEREWVAVIDVIYSDPSKGVPMFKGRWFWSARDVREYHAGVFGGEDGIRPSRLEAHEVIASDNRDSNPVETIVRRASVLSWDSFAKVRRRVVRKTGDWRHVYFCDRMYYHTAGKFREMPSALFPGDPIPRGLMEEVGMPENAEMDEGFEADLEGRSTFTIGAKAAVNEDENVVVLDGPGAPGYVDPNSVYI